MIAAPAAGGRAGGAEPVDVLVVGGGLAGVALATGLRARGLVVLLVERASAPAAALRGEYFQPLGARLARELGLGGIFAAGGAGTIQEFHFRDLEASGRVRAEVLMRLPPGAAGRTLPHRVLAAELWKHARAVLGEAFCTGASAAPEPGAFLDERLPPPVFRVEATGAPAVRVRPRWVVACDGRRSVLRAWLDGARPPNPRWTVRGAGLEFLVGAEIPHPPHDPGRYTLLRSQGRGTIVVFSLGGDRQRLYWNAPAPRGGGPGLRRRWEGELPRTVDAVRAVHDLGPVPPISGAGTAETVWYGPPARGRFLFAGDAAAVTTALGGQGMTCALQHVVSLLEHVDWKEERPGPVRSMGGRYATEVRRAFDRVNVINHCIHPLFFSRSAVLRPLAARVLSRWNEDRSLSDLVLRRFAGLDLELTGLRDLLALAGLRWPHGRAGAAADLFSSRRVEEG